MIRTFLLSFVLLGICLPAVAEDEKGAKKPIDERLKADPDNLDLINEYMRTHLNRINPIVAKSPDKAAAEFKKMGEFLKALKPENGRAKRLMASAVRFVESRVSAMATMKILKQPIAVFEKALKKDASDAKALQHYVLKSRNLITAKMSTPKAARKRLKESTTFLADLADSVKDELVQQRIKTFSGFLTRMESSIDREEKMQKLIGTKAIDLPEVAKWMNGSALKTEDLKGKVVLLDFWAVWCGPCIRTFPELIAWEKEFGKKGLVIIGVTNYQKRYQWNEETKRVSRVDEPLSAEEEHEMLDKFIGHHKLKHRIAVIKTRELQTEYLVSGIPHVVLIDREGKVQLVKVGASSSNAKAIHDKIKALIGK